MTQAFDEATANIDPDWARVLCRNLAEMPQTKYQKDYFKTNAIMTFLKSQVSSYAIDYDSLNIGRLIEAVAEELPEYNGYFQHSLNQAIAWGGLANIQGWHDRDKLEKHIPFFIALKGKIDMSAEENKMTVRTLFASALACREKFYPNKDEYQKMAETLQSEFPSIVKKNMVKPLKETASQTTIPFREPPIIQGVS